MSTRSKTLFLKRQRRRLPQETNPIHLKRRRNLSRSRRQQAR